MQLQCERGGMNLLSLVLSPPVADEELRHHSRRHTIDFWVAGSEMEDRGDNKAQNKGMMENRGNGGKMQFGVVQSLKYTYKRPSGCLAFTCVPSKIKLKAKLSNFFFF